MLRCEMECLVREIIEGSECSEAVASYLFSNEGWQWILDGIRECEARWDDEIIQVVRECIAEVEQRLQGPEMEHSEFAAAVAA